MIQKKFIVDLADKFFLLNPEALNITSNKKLYEFTNALTDAQKQNVRRRKKDLLLKRKDTEFDTIALDNAIDQKPMDLQDAIIIRPNGTSKKLTEAYIERKIYDGLENNPNNVQLIGKATEFFIKVKDKASEMEEEIDIKELLNLGIVKKFNH